MPIYSPALDFIINVGDKSAAGLLALAGSRVVAAPSASSASQRIIRADSRLARVRACVPNLSGERAFDDVDLSASTVQLAIGIPGANPYCLATLDTAFPVAAAQVTTPQSATADLPATKRITLDPAPYGGRILITLDSLDPFEIPFDAEAAQLAALAGPAYTVRKRATNAWEISGTEPNQDITISIDVSGLLVPSGVSGEIELNTVALAAAFTAAGNPKWLRVTREITIDGEAVFQDDKLELAREVLNLTSLVPAPVPPSDYAALAALIAGKQPINGGLTAIAALSTTGWGRALLALSDGGALRTYASLQPLSAQLTAIAALVGAAYGRSLLTASNSTAARLLLNLDEIDNTADVDKPVSTAAQAALDLKAADSAVVHKTGAETIAGVKTFSSAPVVPSAAFPQSAIASLVADLAAKAPLSSPAFTDTPTAPTPVNATSSTQIATTAFVHALITDLLNASPSTLDTLKELADAIGDDPNFATTVAASVAAKLSKASNLSDLTDAAAARNNLGLGNVNNTSDASKPVSTAQAAADAIITAALNAHAALTNNPHAVTKAQVGLGSADNTSDAAKPVSTAQQAALDLKAALAGNNHFTGTNTYDALVALNLALNALDDPGAPTVTAIGTDEGVTRSYKITALLLDGTETAAGPAGTTTHGDETLDSTNKVSLAWTAVSGAVSYNVYRLANAGTSPATIGKIANVLTNAYVDTGAAGDSSTPPNTNGTGGVNGVRLHPKSTSGFVIYASKAGAKLNSNVLTGGCTDDTAALNATLAALGVLGPSTLILDGAALISASLRVPDNVGIQCLNKSCGVYLADDANCHMVTNSNFTSVTNPHEPDSGDRQKNISIIGGTWNGNYSNQSIYVGGNASNSWNCGMWFNGVDDLYLEDVTIVNARKFGLMLTYPGNYEIPLLTVKQDALRTGSGGADTDNNDCVHVWGPCTGLGHIGMLRAINCNDDTLAFNFCESADPSNGDVDFTGRAAAVSTIVDNVYIENGSSILRVDGTLASAGNITIRNVDCLFTSAANNEALCGLIHGKFNRIVCENWTVKIPSTVAGTVSKGFAVHDPQGGCVLELRDFFYTGDASISLISAPNNSFLTIVPAASGTSPAHKIILDNITATKPTASLSGTLVYVADTSASTATIDHIVIRDCSIKNYAFLYANDSAYAQVTKVSTGGNSLGGGASFTGVRPVQTADHDELGDVFCHVYNTAPVTLTHNTALALPFVGEYEDYLGMHSVSSNTSRIVIPQTGKYHISAHVPFASSATGSREIRPLLNGTTILDREFTDRPITGDITILNLDTEWRLAAGDYIELVAVQTSGSDLNVLTFPSSAHMSVRRV